MGNELFGQYSIDKQPFLSGGYLNLWKIYKASHKERKQDVCVFVFEKKNLEKFPSNEREEILTALKKEATSLVKYKHPSILGIVEPLVEDKYSIGFITERFSYTLSSWMDIIKPSKLEIKLMITELCKVISFLHDDAHVIHTNFNPDVIFIDAENKVKVSGMSFAINDPPLSGGEVNLTSIVPNLKYSAPEVIYDRKAFYTSDVFSIGLIIYSLLKIHKGDSDRDMIQINSNSVESYKVSFSRVESKLNQLKFEQDDNSVIIRALTRDHSFRPGIKELMEHQWFNDPKLKALCFVENLAANDMSKNIEFLQKFPKIVGMFENKLIIKRFLPCLLSALRNESLINACLPCIFSICEIDNLKISFSGDVWPKLKDLFQMKSMPAASIYFLLTKVQFIAEHISNSEFSGHFLNIICKALDCNVVKIQTVVIQNLKIITKKIDSLAFKNQIYPRMIQIILSTNSVTFKIEILNALKVLYTLLDQNIINDSLLSNVEKIRKSDNSSQVCMVILGLYEEIAKIVNIESIANKILPNLIGILVNGQISKGNFEITMKLVTTYLERIRKYREKDLVDDTAPFKTNVPSSDNSPFDQFGASASKPGDKDDFLNSFFSGPSSNSQTQPTQSMPMSNPIPSMNMTTNTSTGFDLGFGQQAKPATTNSPFDFTSTNTKPTTNSNLFDGLKVNSTPKIKTQGNILDGLMGQQSKPSTTNDLFAGLNTNSTNTNAYSNPYDTIKTNTQTNNTSSMFDNLNINPQPTMTNLYSNTNTGPIYNMNQNVKRDDILNNLLNDLPSNVKTPSQNNIGVSNMNMNFGTQANTGNSFNQNSLDFLNMNQPVQNTNKNNMNTFDFLAPKQQTNTNNNANYFDFLSK